MNYCIPSLRTPGPRIEWQPRPATCECGERFTQHAPNQTRCPKCAEVRAALMLRRRQERYRQRRKGQAAKEAVKQKIAHAEEEIERRRSGQQAGVQRQPEPQTQPPAQSASAEPPAEPAQVLVTKADFQHLRTEFIAHGQYGAELYDQVVREHGAKPGELYPGTLKRARAAYAALLKAKQELDPPVEEPHYEASYDDLPEALGPQGEE